MNLRIRFLTISTLLLFSTIILVVGLVAVSAQRQVSGDVPLGDIDENVGLEPITVPFFDQPNFLEGNEYYSIFSWISFGGVLFSVGLIIFWIFIIVRSAFQASSSEGEEDKMAESYKRVKSVFVGAATSIAIPLGVSLIGLFLGLGPLWDWPAGLRNCPGSGRDYFFQEVLDQRNRGVEDAVSGAEQVCFSSDVL